MKQISIRSNAYAEYVAFVGAERVTTSSTEWAAKEWLHVMVEKGHKVSGASKLSMADVERHARDTR